MEIVTPENVLLKWRSLPLSDNTDWEILERQITLNAKDWDAAASFLKDTDLGAPPQGRVELTSDGCYANVQE